MFFSQTCLRFKFRHPLTGHHYQVVKSMHSTAESVRIFALWPGGHLMKQFALQDSKMKPLMIVAVAKRPFLSL